MEEYIGEFEFNDQFFPVDISRSEGFRQGKPTTFFSIELGADFEEDFVEIIEDFELEISGYTIECIILIFIEKEKKELLKRINSLDTEGSTFVAYTDTEESQFEIAKLIQKLCTDRNVFQEVINENLEVIRSRLK